MSMPNRVIQVIWERNRVDFLSNTGRNYKLVHISNLTITSENDNKSMRYTQINEYERMHQDDAHGSCAREVFCA